MDRLADVSALTAILLLGAIVLEPSWAGNHDTSRSERAASLLSKLLSCPLLFREYVSVMMKAVDSLFCRSV